MLNIISLQALRSTSTGPSKVAKNLIKGLNQINYPYVINGNLNKYKFLYILDDEKAFRDIGNINKDVIILAGPILQWKKDIPHNLADKYHFLYPSSRIKHIGDKYKWHKNSLLWPAGIDTDAFLPSAKAKTLVLIYFKTRFTRELELCKSILESENIKYKIVNYDIGYKETDFIHLLKITKYVIWIGRQESQGIALQEILSMNIPLLVWDVKKPSDWDPETDYAKNAFEGSEWDEKATSAEYFDDRCGIKIFKKEELPISIKNMDSIYTTFSPREYILETLSLKKQAKQLISYFEALDDTIQISNKKILLFPWRSNFLLKILWFLTDNPLLPVKPIITKIYRLINKIQ